MWALEPDLVELFKYVPEIVRWSWWHAGLICPNYEKFEIRYLENRSNYRTQTSWKQNSADAQGVCMFACGIC
jgi:hypothetical protein